MDGINDNSYGSISHDNYDTDTNKFVININNPKDVYIVDSITDDSTKDIVAEVPYAYESIATIRLQEPTLSNIIEANIKSVSSAIRESVRLNHELATNVMNNGLNKLLGADSWFANKFFDYKDFIQELEDIVASTIQDLEEIVDSTIYKGQPTTQEDTTTQEVKEILDSTIYKGQPTTQEDTTTQEVKEILDPTIYKGQPTTQEDTTTQPLPITYKDIINSIADGSIKSKLASGFVKLDQVLWAWILQKLSYTIQHIEQIDQKSLLTNINNENLNNMDIIAQYSAKWRDLEIEKLKSAILRPLLKIQELYNVLNHTNQAIDIETEFNNALTKINVEVPNKALALLPDFKNTNINNDKWGWGDIIPEENANLLKLIHVLKNTYSLDPRWAAVKDEVNLIEAIIVVHGIHSAKMVMLLTEIQKHFELEIQEEFQKYQTTPSLTLDSNEDIDINTNKKSILIHNVQEVSKVLKQEIEALHNMMYDNIEDGKPLLNKKDSFRQSKEKDIDTSDIINNVDENSRKIKIDSYKKPKEDLTNTNNLDDDYKDIKEDLDIHTDNINNLDNAYKKTKSHLTTNKKPKKDLTDINNLDDYKDIKKDLDIHTNLAGTDNINNLDNAYKNTKSHLTTNKKPQEDLTDINNLDDYKDIKKDLDIHTDLAGTDNINNLDNTYKKTKSHLTTNKKPKEDISITNNLDDNYKNIKEDLDIHTDNIHNLDNAYKNTKSHLTTNKKPKEALTNINNLDDYKDIKKDLDIHTDLAGTDNINNLDNTYKKTKSHLTTNKKPKEALTNINNLDDYKDINNLDDYKDIKKDLDIHTDLAGTDNINNLDNTYKKTKSHLTTNKKPKEALTNINNLDDYKDINNLDDYKDIKKDLDIHTDLAGTDNINNLDNTYKKTKSHLTTNKKPKEDISITNNLDDNYKNIKANLDIHTNLKNTALKGKDNINNLDTLSNTHVDKASNKVIQEEPSISNEDQETNHMNSINIKEPSDINLENIEKVHNKKVTNNAKILALSQNIIELYKKSLSNTHSLENYKEKLKNYDSKTKSHRHVSIEQSASLILEFSNYLQTIMKQYVNNHIDNMPKTSPENDPLSGDILNVQLGVVIKKICELGEQASSFMDLSTPYPQKFYT